MGAEAARVLDYDIGAYYGSAAPARVPYWKREEPIEAEPAQQEQENENIRTRENTHARQRASQVAEQKTMGVSVFAVFGAVLVGVLLVFVVLAQISYAEISAETVRLNAQLEELTEQERRLEIMFESAIDMKEVERYARDTLGMSKPDADQVAMIQAIRADTVEIIDAGEEDGIGGFTSFISSLLDYFR